MKWEQEKTKNGETWELKAGGLRITVLNCHIYYPGQWVINCPQLNIKEQTINAPLDNSEAARTISINFIRGLLEGYLESLPE